MMNSGSTGRATPDWRGRYFEDFAVGDVYTSRVGRTVTEADNVWFTCLTHNTNQMHFNDHYAARTAFGRPLVNSTFTLALITGLTVPDTSENGAANLEWTDIKLPRPVFVGDTLWAQSEILGLRGSQSRPQMGVVTVRSRGINQDGHVVIEFKRTFLAYRRDAEEVQSRVPPVDEPWSVG
jgi:itaconyl-CoA hydratase